MEPILLLFLTSDTLELKLLLRSGRHYETENNLSGFSDHTVIGRIMLLQKYAGNDSHLYSSCSSIAILQEAGAVTALAEKTRPSIQNVLSAQVCTMFLIKGSTGARVGC